MKKKRSIAGCIKEFWPATILTPVFVIGEVVFDVLIPTMTGRTRAWRPAACTTSPSTA